MTFGEFIKSRRREMGLTLRAFCEQNGYDAGNHSKLETGAATAPTDDTRLQELAIALGIVRDTDAWREFNSLANVSRGKIPTALLNDAEVVEKLPVLLRTLEGNPLASDKMDELVEFLRSRQ